MSSLQPAIVIPAYNRPRTLARLLASLQAADYPRGIEIPLVISIDPENGAPNRLVHEAAVSFAWAHGPKQIVTHPEHLGMLNNFYFCGNLTKTYDAVIYLEDDLVLSPVFYHFVQQAHQYFSESTQIAGVSLYAYQYNGYHHYPFMPLADGADVYFAQIMSVLGQSWTSSQWRRFAEWWEIDPGPRAETMKSLHDVWRSFAGDEYFPIQMRYLAATEQFYVFPRVSLTTGFGDQGVHFEAGTSYFQVPLQRRQTEFRFQPLDDSDSVYDSFMEISSGRLKCLAPSLRDFNFDVDLNSTKKLHHFTAEYALTTRACRNPVRTFALSMHPAEANLIFNVEGEGINLCRPVDILWDAWSDLQMRKRLHDYLSHDRVNWQQSLRFCLLNMIRRFRL